MEKLCSVTALGLRNDRTKDGYGYKYAPLEAVIDILKEPLEKAKIGYYFVANKDEVTITVLDLETTGVLVTSQFQILEPKNCQDIGKSITYAKRYLLKTVFNVSEVDDPDDVDNANFMDKANKLNNTKKPNALPKANFF